MPRTRKGNGKVSGRRMASVTEGNTNPEDSGDVAEPFRPGGERVLREQQGSVTHDSVAELQLRLQLAKLQFEENEKQRQHEVQMRNSPAQIPISPINSGDGWGPERQIAYWQGILKPLVPDCDDGRVDLLAFFKVVESLFESYTIPKPFQGRLIIPLLKSRGTSLLVRMESSELNDYDKIKSVVLTQNRLSPAEQRLRYINARKQTSETYGQFAERLRMLWTQYRQGRGAETAEQISELVITDQFREILNPEVKRYVDLQSGTKNQSLDELASLVDIHRLAEVNHSSASRDAEERHGLEPKRSEHWADSAQGPESKATRNGDDRVGRKPRAGAALMGCFACGGDHLVRECPHKARPKPRADQPAGQTKQWQERGRTSPSEMAKTHRVRMETQEALIGPNSSESESAEHSVYSIACVRTETLVTNGAGKMRPPGFSCNRGDKLRRVTVRTSKGSRIRAIVDSGCEISVIRSDCLDSGKVERRGSVVLRPAFGQAKKSELMELDLCLEKTESIIGRNAKVLVATIPDLNEPLLLTARDYDRLERQVSRYTRQGGCRRWSNDRGNKSALGGNGPGSRNKQAKLEGPVVRGKTCAKQTQWRREVRNKGGKPRGQEPNRRKFHGDFPVHARGYSCNSDDVTVREPSLPEGSRMTSERNGVELRP